MEGITHIYHSYAGDLYRDHNTSISSFTPYMYV